MIKNILIFIFAIMLVPVVLADVNYTQTGDFDNAFTRGNSNFNAGLNPITGAIITGSLVASDPKKVPLVNDLDQDGTTEIILLNSNTIIILQNKTLDVAGSLALGVDSSERFSNMITFDVDGDSFDEILLVAEKNLTYYVLNWSEGNLQIQNQFDLASVAGFVTISTPNLRGQIIIGCESTDRCLLAHAETQASGSTSLTRANTIQASHMTSTLVEHPTTLFSVGSAFDVFCAPKIRTMEVVNYDTSVDSDVEFIFTFSQPNMALGGTDDEIHIFWVDIEANGTVTEEIQVTTNEVGEIMSAGTNSVDYLCDNSNSNANFRSAGGFGTAIAGKFFTSPLVFDADPLKAGLETIIGVMTDNNEFIMIMYDATGTEIREFPLVQESEGQIVSNVFQAEIFDDTSADQDFCVFAQESTKERLLLTCGSLNDGDGFTILTLQTIEFRLNNFNEYNLSHDFDEWQIITHSMESDNSNSEDEILTSFGVFEADISDASCVIANCNLNLIFNNPIQDGAVISTDLEGVGLEDWLVLTPTNLFYLDDGFVNQPVNPFCGEPDSVTATCSQVEINPCIDAGSVKLNSSFIISITPKDPEPDQVSARVILYADDPNEQDSGFEINSTSGTTLTPVPDLPFIANKTTGTGVLRLQIKDSENQLIRTLDKSFSVANNGVELNDCKTILNVGVIDEEEDEIILVATLTDDETENSVITGLETFSGISGLAGTTIWLILMIAFSLFIWFQASERGMTGVSALGVVAIVNVLMIVLGARLGILSSALVIIITVLGVVVVGLFFGRLASGISPAGGNGNG